MKKYRVLLILSLIITFIAGTFAWFNYQTNKTSLVLSIGDITDAKVILDPYEINETVTPVNTYSSGVLSNVTAINNSSYNLNLKLYYEINTLPTELINNGLKYTIASSSSETGTYSEITSGDFTSITDNELVILDTTIESSTTIYYKVYLWLDSNYGDQSNLTNLSIDIMLNGEITKNCDSDTLYGTIACQSVLDNKSSTYVTSSSGISFSSISSDTNGKGVYELNTTLNDTYPVYYYRGDVDNNNVLFANYCWQIIRTTDTGGVKLIYNGTQKEVSETENIIESEYTSITNDTTYPYTFDSSTNTWTSTNHTNSATGTITFSVSEAGTYYLNYTVSSESCCDKATIYVDGTQKGQYGGSVSGSISLGSLTTSSVIKVTYSKDSSVSSGSDNVVFSIGKPVGSTTLTCDNTGTDSQIGTSAFNSNYNSLSDVGYMYGTRYAVSSTITSAGGSMSYYYGNGVTYSDGKYTLVNASIESSWSSNYANYKGYYTCGSSTSTTCTSVYYLVGTWSSGYNYITLSNGITADSEILYGSTISYSNGTYTLNGTISIKWSEWSTKYNTLSSNHYTCFSTSNTCSSVYYINYTSSTYAYYATLSNGKLLSDLISETLDYNTTDSTIKTYIDSWYASNMTGYTSYLEDTVFCNDRTIGIYNGWSETGSTTNYLQFNQYTRLNSNSPSLECSREIDSFTVSDENGNGALTYPIGLITADEIAYAGGKYGSSNSNYYLYTDQDFWSLSPGSFVGSYAFVWVVYSSGSINDYRVDGARGVRPVVSLQPGTGYTEGDGSATSPYIIE